MKHPSLQFLATVAAVFLLASSGFLPWRTLQSPFAAIAWLAPILGLAALAALYFAAARSLAQLRTFARYLLAGNYQVAFHLPPLTVAELMPLAEDLNKLAGQLDTYDTLRAERIRQCRSVVQILLEHMSQPAILVDVERGSLEWNPPMRSLAGISQQGSRLAALESIPVNQPFIQLLDKAVRSDRAAQQATLALQLPLQDAAQELHLHILPIKGKDNTVSEALILAGGGDQSRTIAPADQERDAPSTESS